MKRHIFVIATALAIGIALTACGPIDTVQRSSIESIERGSAHLVDKNGDS